MKDYTMADDGNDTFITQESLAAMPSASSPEIPGNLPTSPSANSMTSASSPSILSSPSPSASPSPPDDPIVNFYKFKVLADVSVNPITKYKNSLKNVVIERSDPLYTFLYNLPTLTDKELYLLSLEAEPRQNS